jgi:F-type H+-transporting ATPase subunit gamma
MEMIAALRMKKAQERGLAGRPYSEKITQVIASLAALPQAGEMLHSLLERREVKKVAIVHITPDRGLAGGLVGNINRKTIGLINEQKVPVTMITVGRKGLDAMRRYGQDIRAQDIRAEFTRLGDSPGFIDTLPISRIIIDDFSSGLVDAVYLAYSRFVSTAVQRPEIVRILPVEPAETLASQNVEYIYEPSAGAVLDGLLTRFVEMRIYHSILESIASEQSARMVAMRNATENANELTVDLTLAYNKARQESITTELLDITGGAAALTQT